MALQLSHLGEIFYRAVGTTFPAATGICLTRTDLEMHLRNRISCTFGVLSICIIAITPVFGASQPSEIPESLSQAIAKDYYELELRLPEPAGLALANGVRISGEDLRRWLEADKEQILGALDLSVLYDFEYLPLLLVSKPSYEARGRAASHPKVEAIRPPSSFKRMISATDSSDQIGAGLMRAAGFDGTGASVLVTDSGIDLANIHPDLGGCSAVGQPAKTCRLATYHNLGNNWSFRHGTNVASIVSRTAPGALIHHVNIDCGSAADPQCVSGTLAMQGLNWAIQNANALNIVAHNMSWGVPASSTCFYASSMAAGTAAGIVQVAASGNDGSTVAIGSPANCPTVIAVGRLTTANGSVPLPRNLWSVYGGIYGSNVSSALDVLAPGSNIAAGGYTLGGTSMASPHIAGLVALLKAPSQWDDLSAAGIERILKESGSPFLDSRVGMSFPVPDAHRSRRLRLTVSNPDGAQYTLSPPAIRSCGTGCFEYSELSVTATLPLGYRMTGCVQTTPSTCKIYLDNVRNAKVFAAGSVVAFMSSIISTNDSGSLIFEDGFE